LTAALLRTAAFAVLALGLVACSPRLLIVERVADQLADQGSAEEEDLGLARDASAFYLKASESVLRQSPGHLRLAEAVAGGFTQYAYAFVAFEADRIESQDARAAQRLRERAARLYWRAHRHAMTALELHRPGFARALAARAPADNPKALALDADTVGLAYWAAASWGAHIALSKDRPDVVADLPLVVRLARLAWDRAPTHGEGALAALMGTLEASRPGGDARAAQAYFDAAIAAGGGRDPGGYVAQAEALALPAGDRAAFEALLRQALAAGAERRDLNSQVMRARAQWLLDTSDDRF
jgi:TRAP transporter T-component